MSMSLVIASFAAWAFADEMGVRKPLGRAGLVCFLIAAGTKIHLALAVGIGAAIGVGSPLAVTQGGPITDTGFVPLVERIFGIWAYVSAWMLWRGHIGCEVGDERRSA